MHTGFAHDDGVHFNQTAWYWDVSAEMEALYGRKIPGVMLLHRPPTEMYLVGKNPSMTGLTGEIREEIGAADINTGLFAAAYERGDIRAIISGHDHINNCAGTYLGILLAEDAGLGYDVYGDDDLRGGRVIEFSADRPDVVNTWHIYVKDCIPEEKRNREEKRALTIFLPKRLRFPQDVLHGVSCCIPYWQTPEMLTAVPQNWKRSCTARNRILCC